MFGTCRLEGTAAKRSNVVASTRHRLIVDGYDPAIIRLERGPPARFGKLPMNGRLRRVLHHLGIRTSLLVLLVGSSKSSDPKCACVSLVECTIVRPRS